MGTVLTVSGRLATVNVPMVTLPVAPAQVLRDVATMSRSATMPTFRWATDVRAVEVPGPAW